MLERHWRAQCAELAAPPATRCGGGHGRAAQALQPGRAALGLPGCKAPITALQNIPVVSWLALRGKCASCKRASARAIRWSSCDRCAFRSSPGSFGFGWPRGRRHRLHVVPHRTDGDRPRHAAAARLPDLAAAVGRARLRLWHPAGRQAQPPVGPADSIIGAVAGYLSLWVVYQAFRLLTGKEGMGYGDFKLLAALGAWLGWRMLLPIIMLAAGVGAVVGIALMVRSAGRARPWHSGRSSRPPAGWR